jgi:hypothetical protein
LHELGIESWYLESEICIHYTAASDLSEAPADWIQTGKSGYRHHIDIDFHGLGIKVHMYHKDVIWNLARYLTRRLHTPNHYLYAAGWEMRVLEDLGSYLRCGDLRSIYVYIVFMRRKLGYLAGRVH